MIKIIKKIKVLKSCTYCIHCFGLYLPLFQIHHFNIIYSCKPRLELNHNIHRYSSFITFIK